MTADNRPLPLLLEGPCPSGVLRLSLVYPSRSGRRAWSDLHGEIAGPTSRMCLGRPSRLGARLRVEVVVVNRGSPARTSYLQH